MRRPFSFLLSAVTIPISNQLPYLDPKGVFSRALRLPGLEKEFLLSRWSSSISLLPLSLVLFSGYPRDSVVLIEIATGDPSHPEASPQFEALRCFFSGFEAQHIPF